MIASLAGRRIDAAGADPARFPPDRERIVAERIANVLSARTITALVCAAACGADLLALEAAGRAGVATRIVLPYAAAEFRRRSVTDRGDAWGTAFDPIVADADRRGALHVLGLDADDPHAYDKTNEAILDDALALAGRDPAAVVALTVWDGAIAERVDYTAGFAAAARARGIAVESIPILG